MTDYLRKKLDFTNPELVAAYDQVFLWSARFGELLFKHLELRRNLRVLDLACGTGFPLLELAHMLGRSCELVGVDMWKEALERARLKLKVYDLPNVQLVEADGAALPFPDASFDLIVSNLGINNFAHPQAALAECFRVTKVWRQHCADNQPPGAYAGVLQGLSASFDRTTQNRVSRPLAGSGGTPGNQRINAPASSRGWIYPYKDRRRELADALS
jgi:SAM-dependent methyltransferase